MRYAWDYRKAVMDGQTGCCRLIFGEADAFPGQMCIRDRVTSLAPHDSKARLRVVTKRRDSWRSHVHRTYIAQRVQLSLIHILESDGKQQMLYKHAISTIVPIAAIDLKGAEESEE